MVLKSLNQKEETTKTTADSERSLDYWLAQLSRKRWMHVKHEFKPYQRINGSHRQETLPSMLTTGWFRELGIKRDLNKLNCFFPNHN